MGLKVNMLTVGRETESLLLLPAVLQPFFDPENDIHKLL